MRALVPWLIVAGIWVGAGGVVAGFLMPWATLQVKRAGVVDGTPLADVLKGLTQRMGRVVIHVKRGAETITGELPDLSSMPSTIRGADIPVLANRQDIKGVAAIAELITGQQALGQVGIRSYVVYLVPGLAILFAVVGIGVCRPRWIAGAAGVLCLAIAGAWWWKLTTMKIDTKVITVVLAPGLWLSCGSYAGLGAALLARALTPRAPRD